MFAIKSLYISKLKSAQILNAIFINKLWFLINEIITRKFISDIMCDTNLQ